MQVDKLTKYLLVDAKVLPEAFTKVVHAKRLLAQGKAKNLSEATRLADISRSAFYKYKDHVFDYQHHNTRQIATLSCELADEAGVLSGLLATLSESGGNVLTINQNIPVDGVAHVSIALRCDHMDRQIEDVLRQLSALEGVVRVRLVNT